MATIKRKGFFGQSPARPEDELARQQDVEALIVPRRTVVQDLPVERIRPNPYQARKQFENLEELAAAIKVQGFTSRLRVRPDPFGENYFQLIYGERRLRAAVIAGLLTVPCEIAGHSDEEMLEIGLAENIQRQDLTPLEEAQAFQTFLRERGYSIRSLAEKIGKDKSYVQDRLELLKIPTDVQAMVVQRADTLRAAREIAKLNSPAERKPLIEGIIEGKLNVQDIRAVVSNQTAHLESTSVRDPQSVGEISTPDPIRQDPHSIARQTRKVTKSEPSLDHQIERDGRFLLSTLGKWQEQFSSLGEDQRKLLGFYLDQLFPELEKLKKRLQD